MKGKVKRRAEEHLITLKGDSSLQNSAAAGNNGMSEATHRMTGVIVSIYVTCSKYRVVALSKVEIGKVSVQLCRVRFWKSLFHDKT